MRHDYVICTRDVKANGQFGTDCGLTQFLKVPADLNPAPPQSTERMDWVREVLTEATGDSNAMKSGARGDILVYIHGYNNTQNEIMQRHRRLKQDLLALGFKGAVISFDWPTENCFAAYLEDLADARATAVRLVKDCIMLFARLQSDQCRIRVHLLAHSMGCLVVRDAFTYADDYSPTACRNWTISQVAFIAGDVASYKMADEIPDTRALYRHAARLTNYWNPLDWVLNVSDVKSGLTAPRAGRIGLPKEAHTKAVDVNCGPYFKGLSKSDFKMPGVFEHSWHIGDPAFTQDLFLKLNGDLDRWVFPTRQLDAHGKLQLAKPV